MECMYDIRFLDDTDRELLIHYAFLSDTPKSQWFKELVWDYLRMESGI
jgi:hypothetical protein